MSDYKVLFENREEIAEGTMAFHFEKPGQFSFKPGQAIDLVLIGPPTSDPQSVRHTFSIVSAPFEDRLSIATRMRDSAFKRALRTLVTGSPIQIEGPFGSLTLHKNLSRPAILIAGGIGITPFVSMLRQAEKEKTAQKIVLLYSNRRPEDTAFLAELQEMERLNKNFRLVATMTQMNKSTRPWSGETGSIGESLVRRVSVELASPVFYLAGPPSMVEAMRETLNLSGVEDDDIRSEEFYGY